MQAADAVLVGDPALAAAIGVGAAARPVAGARLLIVPPPLLEEALAAGGAVVLLGAPDCALARATLLDRGAADVLPGATPPVELAARVRALLRLVGGGRIACGDLVVNPIDRSAHRAGRPLSLHPREFAVLLHLARARGAAVSRAGLYCAVWGRGFDPGTNVVAVTVSRLRARLHGGGAAPLLHTTPAGYVLAPVVAGSDAAAHGGAV